MKRKHALLFAFLITGLIASNYYLFSSLQTNNLESSLVIRVLDGDTLELQDSRRLRLLNINAPEKSSPNFNPSFQFLKQLENQIIQFEITESDRYERSLSRIYHNNNYINLQIVKEGYASKFLVDKSELSLFSKAEAQAIREEKGIWKHSQYNGCFKTEIDKKEEFVIISNKCPKINMHSFTLKDESTKTFTFPDLSFSKITLHSSKGDNSQTELFWNSNQNIWNNDRDSLYIFDSQGGLAHYETYGY
jgi:endonuclease YncB( thermonuclease family)